MPKREPTTVAGGALDAATRVQRAKGALARLEVEARRGEHLDAQEVEVALSGITSGMRLRVLGVAGGLRAEAGLTLEAFERLDAVIREGLAHLADCIERGEDPGL